MQQTTGKLLARGAMLVAVALATGLPLSSSKPAFAAPGHAETHKPAAAGKVRHTAQHRAANPIRRGPVLQCVTFARDASGIHLSGNAHAWWYNAAGQFQRGQRPERGAVLNFRSSGGMRMGHVSVVSRVVSEREILIDDANWAAPGQRKGMVRRAASVIDVSANNDWTEVRVANGIGSWGRVYPTYGFIYPRADRGDERIEIAAARDAQPAYSRAPQGPAASAYQPQGAQPAASQPTASQPTSTLPAGSFAMAGLGTTALEAPIAVPGAKGWTWVMPQAPTPQNAAPRHAAAAPTAQRAPQAAPQPTTTPSRWVWANGVAAAH